MKHRLTDLIDIKESQTLLDSFSDVVGIASAIIDLEGNVLVGSSWQKICTHFHRANTETSKRCIESDTVLANELLSGKRFSLYRCRNGLTDAASPIVIEGEHVANAFVGQFLTGEPDRQFFRLQAAERGFNESSYLEALALVPIVPEKNLPSILAFLASFAEIVANMGLKQLKQLEIERELRKTRDELDLRVGERTAELSRANRMLCTEIEERKIIERQIKARNTILRLMTEASDRKEYLDGIVSLIRSWTRCTCVGIRVLDAQGNIPYASHTGFEESFLAQENWISLQKDNCACTRVIKGEPHPFESGCMTRAGSFFSNDTAKLVAELSKEEQAEFRGECIRHGFLSVAIVPIRDRGGVIGAIHLCDRRSGRVFESDIEFLEGLSGLLGEGIVKFNMKDALKRHNDAEEALNRILQLSLKDIEIETFLTHVLDTVLAIPWLPLEPAGAIFLIDDDPELLVLKAQRGLSEDISSRWQRMPLCGFFDGSAAAGAARGCRFIPIKLGDRLLGVLAFFSAEGIGQQAKAQELINVVAASLAGIIQRRELEESLKKRETLLNTVLDNLPVGIEVVNTHGKLMRDNPAARLIFGGMEDRQSPLAQVIGSGEALLNQFSDICTPEGKQKSILHSAIPIRSSKGEVSAAISVIHDISEQKKAEEELKIYMKRLERSNQDLQEFAFVASHDLREPLRKVQSFGRLLSQKFGDALEEQGRDYLLRMVDAARRMDELLEGLLKYSRVTTHGNSFSPTDLNRVVQDTLSDMEIAIGRSGSSIEIGALPEIEADETQMRQLFQNLIGNAIKYQAVGSTPRLRIFSETECKSCRIYVEDNGIGFDEKHIEKIFAPFQRLHGRSSPYEGTGMGLAICRKIVERHNGTITAKSSPANGSTFIVTLPLRQ